MKKTMKYLLAMLPVVAGLMFSSCSNEEAVAEQPAKQDIEELGKVQYSLTVSKADATTRATIGADLKTIQFDDDDTELYVYYNYKAGIATDERFLFGTLSRTSLSADKMTATFSGELTDARYTNTSLSDPDYTVVAPPVPFNIDDIDKYSYWKKADVTLKNTGFTTAGDLFKEYNTLGIEGYGEQFWGRKDISPTMYNYNNALYGSLEDAMAHCHLYGNGDFVTGSFTLNPNTAFLVFTFTLQDGSAAGDVIKVEATDLTEDETDFPDRTGEVTAYKDGDEEDSPIKATVVIPVRGGRDGNAGALWSTNPMLTITTKHEEFPIAFRSKLTANGAGANYAARVYRFKKTLVGTPTVNYEAVDLGLPSGLKWATTNIGATAPEESGLFFQWSSTDGHSATEGFDFTGLPQSVFNYLSATELSNTDDAAIPYMGEGWRIPSQADVLELINNTAWAIEEVNGVQGFRFTNKKDASKSIFIPQYKGYNRTTANVDNVFVWTRTRGGNYTNAYALYYNKALVSYYDFATQQNTLGSLSVQYGLPIRGVTME